MLKAVFFDLDGTVADTLPELYEGIRCFAAASNLADPGMERSGNMIGAGVRVLAERLLGYWRAAPEGDRGLTVDDVASGLVEEWAHLDGSLSRFFPGVLEGIEALRAAGLLTILVTNKEKNLAAKFLKDAGADGCFDAVVGGGDCARLKPYADPIELALRLAGASPDEAAMVGDSRNDALAARAANVSAYLVRTGYNEGVPLDDWARGEGFKLIFDDAAAVCAAILKDVSK